MNLDVHQIDQIDVHTAQTIVQLLQHVGFQYNSNIKDVQLLTNRNIPNITVLLRKGRNSVIREIVINQYREGTVKMFIVNR